MILTLEFYIDEPVSSMDLDELSDQVREAVDKVVGETDYMVQEVKISSELIDYF